MACPLTFVLVPPDKFFAFAPWLSVGTRRGAIVENASIRRPRVAPTMPEIVFGFPRIGQVHSGLGMDSRVDPATTCCTAIRLQFRVPANKFVTTSFVAVDLAYNFVNHRLGMLTLGRIVPCERIQSSIARTRIGLCFRLNSAAEVIHEPGFAATIARWIDRLLVKLNKALCVREGTLFLHMRCSREEEYFCGDVLRLEFSPFDLGRVVPKRSGLGFDELAHDEPFELTQGLALQASIGCTDGWILSHDKHPFHLAVHHVHPVTEL